MRLIRTDRSGKPILSGYHNNNRKRGGRRHSQLFTLVRNRHWDIAIRHAKSHPQEVLFQDDDGNTPLHIACKLDPPANLIVEAMSTAVSKANKEGATPLHIAASNRCSSEAIRAMLSVEEGAAAGALTRNGRAPIHCACYSHRGLSFQAFRILFEASIKTTTTIKNAIDITNDCYGLEDLMEDDEYFGGEKELPPIILLDDNQISNNNETTTIIVATLQDQSGQTPLGLLFSRYRERVRNVIQEMERLDPAVAATRVQTDLGELWDKARWIVSRLTQEQQEQAVRPPIATISDNNNTNSPTYNEFLSDSDTLTRNPRDIAQESAEWAREQFFTSRSNSEGSIMESSDTAAVSSAEQRPFRLVHASVGLTGFGCPPEMIRLALSIYPHQIDEMDEDGNLPIHICASALGYSLNNNNNWDSNIDDDDCSFMSDFSFFTTASCNKPTPDAFEKVFRMLLRRFPKAAQIPHGISGQLPLALALDRRTWNDGIETLLQFYPAALEQQLLLSTPPVALYPHILAKIGGTCHLPMMKRHTLQNNKGRNTIFELLRAKPELVKGY